LCVPIDGDNDGYVDADDIRSTMDLFSDGLGDSDKLREDQSEAFAAHVLREADLDGDERISPLEFEHMASRIPNFFRLFQFRV
jgi:Ca2+-binding EF-hand superfamily protein